MYLICVLYNLNQTGVTLTSQERDLGFTFNVFLSYNQGCLYIFGGFAIV